jgi:5-methylcytosine-specific restriction protein A
MFSSSLGRTGAHPNRRMMVTVPQRIASGCQHPSRCPNRATKGNYCAAHARKAESIYEAQRGTAAARGYDYRWARISRAVLHEQPVCADPFRKGCCRPSCHTDHIVPRRQGGSDERCNLQGLCSECHSAKTLLEQRVKFTLLCGCPDHMLIEVRGNEVVVACNAHAGQGMIEGRLWPTLVR